MFNSAFLDTIIAFAFVFAAASAACSALFETVSSLLGLRGFFLKKTVNAMLGAHAAVVISHPALQALRAGLWGFPSYVDPQLFGEIVYAQSASEGANGSPATTVDRLKPFFRTAVSPSGAVGNPGCLVHRLHGPNLRCLSPLVPTWPGPLRPSYLLSAAHRCDRYSEDALCELSASRQINRRSSRRDGDPSPIDLGLLAYKRVGDLGVLLAAFAISYRRIFLVRSGQERPSPQPPPNRAALRTRS